MKSQARTKRFRVGMYGGKFLPFHKGHFYCLQTAALECEKIFLILFSGGAEEQAANQNSQPWLSVESRMNQLNKAAQKLKNLAEIIPVNVDISSLIREDGSDDWDAETALVLKAVGGRLDAVYSSEPSYADYFARAYPGAVHRLVDPERTAVPISGTKIRQRPKEERWFWMI